MRLVSNDDANSGFDGIVKQSIGVQRGDSVQMNQELGRSGTTGLAGGDHLHFTMLLGGRAVTPIDWWSAQWVEDRITRKLREAGAG